MLVRLDDDDEEESGDDLGKSTMNASKQNHRTYDPSRWFIRSGSTFSLVWDISIILMAILNSVTITLTIGFDPQILRE